MPSSGRTPMRKRAPDLYQIVILSEAKDLLFAAEESRSFASLRMTTLKNQNLSR